MKNNLAFSRARCTRDVGGQMPKTFAVPVPQLMDNSMAVQTG